jgi:hypothetical protein
MSNQPSAQKVYCFLDADALLNFKTFDEVDWPSILGTDVVYLVLAPTIMKELNKHKDDASNEWRQDRARTLVSKFKKLFRRADDQGIILVRNGVSLMRIAREPLIGGGWEALGLDHRINDDRTIASMLEWRDQHPETPICFVSTERCITC